MADMHGTTGSPRVGVETNVVTPIDRVRWGPIIAGLFAALSAMALLTVLGLAIGFSSVDADDKASSFGIGAGIWGVITALASFFFGGWISARMAAVRGGGDGMWQGAMVWMVAIPLLLYMLVGGIGSLMGTAGKAAATAVQAGATVAGGAASASDTDRTNVEEGKAKATEMKDVAKATTQKVAGDVRQKAEEIKQSVTPQKVEQAAGVAARGAWGTLVSMILGLAAAAVGGFVGVRGRSNMSHATVR